MCPIREFGHYIHCYHKLFHRCRSFLQWPPRQQPRRQLQPRPHCGANFNQSKMRTAASSLRRGLSTNHRAEYMPAHVTWNISSRSFVDERGRSYWSFLSPFLFDISPLGKPFHSWNVLYASSYRCLFSGWNVDNTLRKASVPSLLQDLVRRVRVLKIPAHWFLLSLIGRKGP